MTSYPPPYAPGETKGLYPEIQGGPVPQQQYPGVYYPPQGSPAFSAAPGTASVTYYPTGPQQQQPQQLVINQPPVVVQAQQPPPSFVLHILLSCCVTWCCFWPCGLLAFVCAMVGYCKATSSPSSARQCGTASIVFSILGIVISVIAIIVIVVVTAVYGIALSDLPTILEQDMSGCKKKVFGRCYRYSSILTKSNCANLYSDSYYSSDGYCYYNY